ENNIANIEALENVSIVASNIVKINGEFSFTLFRLLEHKTIPLIDTNNNPTKLESSNINELNLYL
ncbi:hypothetical protein, partial [Vibrio cholerae]|uniref:hypothetical protein n=1 Tax=Vibrio cholerae TaxID=666 RepID=UPI001F3AB0D6